MKSMIKLCVLCFAVTAGPWVELVAQERPERGERPQRPEGGERPQRGGAGGGDRAGRWANMSDEERQAARQRMRNISPEELARWQEIGASMSEEERRAWRDAGRGMSREEQTALGQQIISMSPEERAVWFEETRARVLEGGNIGSGDGGATGGEGQGGSINRGGRGGREGSLRANVPEAYQPLIANSPFMSDEYRASLVGTSAQRNRREVQFTGLSRPGGSWVFGLEERRANRTYWLVAGETENGVEILEFDETSQTLTVSLDGNQSTLRLSPNR